ncbi:MAG: hypothetical protein JO168_02415 [Solirubrobacterales bacterium]|nr:hypothetical protein [Solirubrobacterales bacterium]MBV9716291.1 hypothetical protein [Solirubrobacterales bacterium]
MSRRAFSALVLLVCGLLAGCGSQHPKLKSNATGTPATDAQVLTLARVLESDFEHGGARFTANLQVNGQPAQATGRVDFRSGRGTALVSPTDPGLGPPRRFYWTRSTVLAQAAPGSRQYQRQVPDEQGNPVHGMIGFINLLSAETIDNTANIAAAAPRLIGHTTISGAPVDEFRYGLSGDTTLWILTGSELLRQVYTTRVTGGLTIDLLTHEPVKIDLPPAAHA